MKTRPYKRYKYSVLFAITMLPASGAISSVMLGSDLGDGSFIDISYGDPDATGLAYVNPFLYAGGLLDSPTVIDTTTLLSFDYNVTGLGSNLMQVGYTITNDDTESFDDLRFIVKVDPNGNLGADLSGFNDTASIQWGAKVGGDPDNYQVAEFVFGGGLQDSIFSNNGLDGSNSCPGDTCDVDFALQWDLVSLAPGQSWNINIGLADNGSSLSTRFLRADSADGPKTNLTFSGTASVIPVPASVYLLGSGLLAIIGLGRRKSAGKT